MTAGSWIVCAQPRSKARLRLYCLPYAGSGAAGFRGWPDHLPENVEVRCIQPPGRERRLWEPAFDRMAPLVDAAANALEHDFGAPYAFFGHSMGALIAFELTRELRRRSAPQPVRLFASGYRAPHVRESLPSVRGLDDEAFVREVDRRYGAIPREVRENRELMELLLPGLRSDISICETYRYRHDEPLECPIEVFGGIDDHLDMADLEAWREHTRGTFGLTMLPGGHFFLKTAQLELMRILSRNLDGMTAELLRS
jgi:medium-chain acyl-[acyl-carrier-protein] hydrolase